MELVSSELKNFQRATHEALNTRLIKNPGKSHDSRVSGFALRVADHFEQCQWTVEELATSQAMKDAQAVLRHCARLLAEDGNLSDWNSVAHEVSKSGQNYAASRSNAWHVDDLTDI